MKTWTDEETRILVEHYNLATNSELAKLLPNKSVQGIYKKAYKMGLRKSREIEYQNRSEARKGDKGSKWKGGTKSHKGYRQILKPDHPRADSAGYVLEHIIVWEEETGVAVPKNCCVHHLNGDKKDNRIENLCLMQFAAHTVHHHKGRKCTESTKKKISKRRLEKNAK